MLQEIPRTTTSDKLHLPQLTLFADRYQYDEATDRLGGGVFGVVYRADDTRQRFSVALKLLKKGTLPDEAYREAQILTRLGGDYVLQIHNTGTADDIPYLATRIAPLGSTEDFLAKSAPFGAPPDVAVAWIRNALLGLASAHEQRWVHRDVKPGNVFLERLDWSLIGDFGVAGMMNEQGRVAAHGDQRVCAPEMYTSGFGDVRSDIFSTGVTLYRLLSGEWPFDTIRGSVPDQIVAGAYPPLADVAPHISRALAARVTRAMALNPDDRFQTARQMHAALGRGKLVPAAWQRISPHNGHERCWIQRQRLAGSKARFQACTIPSGGGLFDVDCRRIAGTRVVRHCHEGVPSDQLLKRVRAMLRGLS